MKTKNFQKKLTLNKKTIVHLNNGQLGNIKGALASVTRCYLCPTYTCPEVTVNDETCPSYGHCLYTDCTCQIN